MLRVMTPVVLVVFWCGVFAETAEAQLFGQRQLGRPFGQRAKPDDAVGGKVTGSERYVRGNRQSTDFVGADPTDSGGFVGIQQATPIGRVRSAAESLRTRRRNRRQLNPRYPRQTRNTLYAPRLTVSPSFTLRPAESAQTNLTSSFRDPGTLSRLGNIQIAVRDRRATLTGTVPSEDARSLAEALSMLEPGIEAVQNDLKISVAVPPQPGQPFVPPSPQPPGN